MTELASPELPRDQIDRLERCFPARPVSIGAGVQVSVRECGAGADLPLVCLHGIGSGAASWLEAAALLAARTRVIAWDAPGYGESTPLPMDAPRGGDYAARLHALLDALEIQRCILVGHSLGALMAAPAARHARGVGRFAALVMISPAQGYGAPRRAADAQRVRGERLRTLAELGVAGMAARRSARLVCEHASPVARAWVRWNMARLRERGYRQAVELLCGDDLLAYLPPDMPARVLCGEHDAVTPPAGCAEVAAVCGVALEPIADAGHACYVEQPATVAGLLGRALTDAQGCNPGGKP